LNSVASRAKRLIDVAIATVLLVAALPLIVVIGALLRAATGEGPLLRQQRAGLGGAPFSLLKLRTMTEGHDINGRLLPDEQRTPTLGRWIRALSIDELPQLVNVLRGEMSLVGPRPLPVQYYRLFTESERVRLMVRPGLTGWAQIHGRHRLAMSARLALDVWYVHNWSLRMDLAILLKTIRYVAARPDIHTINPSALDARDFATPYYEFLDAERRRSDS
jgi:sugar transferase EpsL